MTPSTLLRSSDRELSDCAIEGWAIVDGVGGLLGDRRSLVVQLSKEDLRRLVMAEETLLRWGKLSKGQCHDDRSQA
ncbi:MAG: hypothetical protein HC860_27245 [Alkalinema sp. RU_4_3]|nr:hypothetical protein [Alkalinema sp. RU_4_3]